MNCRLAWSTEWDRQWKERKGWTDGKKEGGRGEIRRRRKEWSNVRPWVSFSQFAIYFRKPGELRATPRSFTSWHIYSTKMPIWYVKQDSFSLPASVQEPGIGLMDLSDSSPPPITHTHTYNVSSKTSVNGAKTAKVQIPTCYTHLTYTVLFRHRRNWGTTYCQSQPPWSHPYLILRIVPRLWKEWAPAARSPSQCADQTLGRALPSSQDCILRHSIPSIPCYPIRHLNIEICLLAWDWTENKCRGMCL